MTDFTIRTIVRVARLFDGVTEETPVGYDPPVSQNFLRSLKSSTDPVGSFSTLNLSSADAKRPLAVWYRLDGNPNTGSVMNLRTASASDSAGLDYPNLQLLSALPLTTEFKGPIILGATDRLCPVHDDAILDQAAIEFMVIDAAQAAQIQLITGLTTPPIAEDCCSVQSITINASQELAPWTGTLFVYLNGPALLTVDLPPLANEGLDRQAVFVRVGGGVAFVRPNSGEAMNGQVDGVIELSGFGSTIVSRRELTWSASNFNLSSGQTLQLNVINATVDIAAPRSLQEPVRIEANTRGFARLPALSASPINDVIPLLRNGGLGQIIVVPQVGESLNGEVNGQLFLGANNGAVALRTLFGWLVVGDSGERACRSLSLAADTTLDAWGDDIVVLGTQAAAQTITLPPIATNFLKVGCRARIGCAGAGGLTIASGGGGVLIRTGSGAPAATLVLAVNQNADLIWSGTFWFAVRGS